MAIKKIININKRSMNFSTKIVAIESLLKTFFLFFKNSIFNASPVCAGVNSAAAIEGTTIR